MDGEGSRGTPALLPFGMTTLSELPRSHKDTSESICA